ncbi:hypothetical protein HYW75_01115 [Candidatus Pacearchaeota archaeon]|nr:hypothetical protein [Candidatus Pacearchaeota archaeon]
MVYYYLIPKWFFGLDVSLKFLFAFITLAVSFFSYKIYKLSEHRETKLFGISFFLIFLSFLSSGLVNSIVLSGAKSAEDITHFVIERNTYFLFIGLFLHMVFYISGLITLVYTQFKLKNGKVYYIMLGLALLIIFSAYNKVVTFNILAVFLITFIIYNYINDYAKSGNKKIILVIIAFVLLLLSSANFSFSLAYYQAYIVGHILELMGYLLIALSLILSLKK